MEQKQIPVVSIDFYGVNSLRGAFLVFNVILVRFCFSPLEGAIVLNVKIPSDQPAHDWFPLFPHYGPFLLFSLVLPLKIFPWCIKEIWNIWIYNVWTWSESMPLLVSIFISGWLKTGHKTKTEGKLCAPYATMSSYQFNTPALSLFMNRRWLLCSCVLSFFGEMQV